MEFLKSIHKKRNKLKTAHVKILSLKNYQVFLIILLLVGTSAALFLYIFNFLEQEDSVQSVRTDLSIPVDSNFLHREYLLAQIKKIFDDEKEIKNIPWVGIIGIGGAGKTTLAREFARKEKASIVWELNAETIGSLKNSFKELAYSLPQTPESKKELSYIKEIKDKEEQDTQFFLWLKKQLKKNKNWILIFDNVEDFSQIKQYLPKDSDAWGSGKVIVTTRDSNISNTGYMKAENTINIRELSAEEALTLFSKIRFDGNPSMLSNEQRKEILSFLKKIPPFPLDISIAARYLRNAFVSYDDYINDLKSNTNEFNILYNKLIYESTDYSKTRYNIVTLSLKKVLEENPRFKHLIILISILDSQEIPIALLTDDHNSSIGNNLIYFLKKFSLVWSETDNSNSTIRIHRSTQEIFLEYLINEENVNKNKNLIEDSIEKLEKYIDRLIEKEDILSLQNMILHIEKCLFVHQFLSEDVRYSLKSKLGNIYYYSQSGFYDKAKEILKENIETSINNKNLGNKNILNDLIYIGRFYAQEDKRDSLKELIDNIYSQFAIKLKDTSVQTAWALSFLGDMFNVLGEYKKAKEVLERSCDLYRIYHPQEKAGRARSLAYLGNVYVKLGYYDKSLEILKKSEEIYRSMFPAEHYRIAWILQIMGRAYVSLKEYDNAIKSIEASLNIYKKYFSEDKVLVAWASAYLGLAYAEKGETEKAEKLLLKRREISKKHYGPEHHISALECFILGKIYLKGLEIEQAIEYLELSFDIYKKIFGSNHLDSAWVMSKLAEAYYQQGNLEAFQKYLEDAINIFVKYRHPDSWKSLESLSKFLSNIPHKVEKVSVKS